MRQFTSHIFPVALIALLLPGTAHAHTALVAPYELPVPLSLYLYACAATLILTFVVIGYVVSVPRAAAAPRIFDVPPEGPLAHIFRWCLRVLRVGALACLILSVVAGLIGIQHPLGNINITLFWLIFLLGCAYLTALIGNIYQLISPWKALTFYAEACGLDLTKARIAYPARLGYYPAFLFYIALIWIELFVLPRPATLSVVLVVYTLITLVAVSLFGKTAWFEYGELFSVFFRLFGAIAPIAYTPIKDGHDALISFRRPFVGLLQERPTHVSLVLFVLFMLSSTTYDAIHEMEFWRGLYWQNAVTLTRPLWGTNLAKAQSLLLPWYLVYQRVGLVLSPFVYLGLYLLALGIAKAVTRADISLRRLALQFAFTIIPIALVYNITHNLTSILTQIPTLPSLLTDPFGFGWNLFRISTVAMPTSPLEMGPVWHTQVALMLGGHMISVYLAHTVALRLFPSRYEAWVSQVPIVALMVGYTVIGITILTFPIQAVPD